MNMLVKIGILGLILAGIFNKNHYHYQLPCGPESCAPEEPIKIELEEDYKQKLSFRWQKSTACDKLGLNGTAALTFRSQIDLMAPSGKEMFITLVGSESPLFDPNHYYEFYVNVPDDHQRCLAVIKWSMFRGYLIDVIAGLYRRIIEFFPVMREEYVDPETEYERAEMDHKATKCGSLLALASLNKSEVDRFGKTSMHFAASSCNATIFKALIDSGADIHAKARWDHETPLHSATKHGANEVCELLIKKGANIHATTKMNLTPLHNAAGRDNSEICEILIDKGADVRVKDDSGETPLHYAAEQGTTEICELLIKNGANIDAIDSWGNSPLNIAARRGNADICAFLIAKGADINSKDKSGERPLHGAAAAGNREICKLLIDKGTEIDSRNVYGETPLMHAIDRSSSVETCEVLTAAGADIHAKSDAGWTPLHFAAFRRKSQIVELLIEKGADVNAKTKNGETPLILAAKEESIRICKLLIENGAGVNVKDFRGRTWSELVGSYELNYTE